MADVTAPSPQALDHSSAEDPDMPRSLFTHRNEAPPPPLGSKLPASVWRPPPTDSQLSQERARRAEVADQEGRRIARDMAALVAMPKFRAPDPAQCGHRWDEVVKVTRLVPTDDGMELRKVVDTHGFSWVCTRKPHDGDEHQAHDQAGKVLAEVEPEPVTVALKPVGDGGNSGGNVRKPSPRPKRPVGGAA